MGKKNAKISIGLGDLLGVAEKALSNKKVQKLLCGTYSDGTPRDILDAWNGEVLSPREKRKKLYKKKKKVGKKRLKL